MRRRSCFIEGFAWRARRWRSIDLFSSQGGYSKHDQIHEQIKAAGALAVVCGFGVAYAQSPAAQPTASAPKFEAASVKRCAHASSPGSLYSGSPGRYSLSCATLTNLINLSYVIYANGTANFLGERQVPIERGPEWARSEQYTIEAKAEGAPSQGMMQG